MRTLTVSPLAGSDARLELCLRDPAYEFVDHSRRPCVLICPGGGYAWVAAREAEPIAIPFLQAGFQTAVLTYSVRPQEGLPFLEDLPLREAAASVRCLRTHAAEWGIDPDRITVCGFSAGGHLAGSLGVFGADETRLPGSGDGLSRPNAMILCYAVTAATCPTHPGSFYNLTGENAPGPAWDRWSLDLHVSKNTCPAFLWHTVNDDCVPVEGALAMARSLLAHQVPFELHLYAQGPHGLSISTAETGFADAHVGTWMPLALEWLKEMGVGVDY